MIVPENPATWYVAVGSGGVWVGIGENKGGRHIGFGDGIYRSDDGGQAWKPTGLRSATNISHWTRWFTAMPRATSSTNVASRPSSIACSK